MVDSGSVRIALDAYRTEVLGAIKFGFVSPAFLDSKLYDQSKSFLIVIIICLEPLSKNDIKEIVLMVFKAFAFSTVKDEQLDNDINSTWEKYKHAFFENLGKKLYVEYELDKTVLKIKNASFPLSAEAFMELLRKLNPNRIPFTYEEFVAKIGDISHKLSTNGISNEFPKFKCLYTETQLKSICAALKSNSYVHENTNEAGFVDLFLNYNFSNPIIWIDKPSKNTPAINKLTIFQLVFKIIPGLIEPGNRSLLCGFIFKGFQNVTGKFPPSGIKQSFKLWYNKNHPHGNNRISLISEIVERVR